MVGVVYRGSAQIVGLNESIAIIFVSLALPIATHYALTILPIIVVRFALDYTTMSVITTLFE